MTTRAITLMILAIPTITGRRKRKRRMWTKTRTKKKRTFQRNSTRYSMHGIQLLYFRRTFASLLVPLGFLLVGHASKGHASGQEAEDR